MSKISFIKILQISLVALVTTLVLIGLQLIFPKFQLVETYFLEITLSVFMAVVCGSALIVKFLLNILKIEPPAFLKKSITYFINQVSNSFIGMFGFCCGMIIVNMIFGHYDVIGLYTTLGFLGLVYGSVSVFLNEKLETTVHSA